MVLTVAVGRQFFSPEAIVGLRDDAVAAFFWMANWMFVADKTGYFAQGAPPSPCNTPGRSGWRSSTTSSGRWCLSAVAVVLAARARRQDKRATLGGVRLTVFLLATLGTLGSAAAAILLASDATRDRVYFGTDTRAQALLMGAAASALLGRRLGVAQSRMVADSFGVGQVDRQGASRWSAWCCWGGCSLRHRQRPRIPQRPADRRRRRGGVGDRPSGAGSARAVATVLAWGPLAWLGGISYGILPVALADLSGAQRSAHRMARPVVVRCPVRRHAGGLGGVVVGDRAAGAKVATVQVPLLPLAGATAATAAAGDAAGGSGRAQARHQRTRRQPSSRLCRRSRSCRRHLHRSPARRCRREARPAAAVTVSVFGDSIGWTMMHFLPQTPGFPIHRPHRDRLQLVRGGRTATLARPWTRKANANHGRAGGLRR